MNIPWAKFFDKLVENGHLPIGFFVFLTGTALQWFHHLDGTYIAFSSTVLGFLAHHEYMQPDAPAPVVVPKDVK